VVPLSRASLLLLTYILLFDVYCRLLATSLWANEGLTLRWLNGTSNTSQWHRYRAARGRRGQQGAD
jgi:hypothetical protein